jgi:hypothetical protein
LGFRPHCTPNQKATPVDPPPIPPPGILSLPFQVNGALLLCRKAQQPRMIILHDFLFNCHAPIDPIAILPSLTRWLLHIDAQIFYPVLFYIQTIVQSLLVSFLRVCHCNCLPAILTIGQYFADELYKNLVLIINRSLLVCHAYGSKKKQAKEGARCIE